jgi:hypothetical protein
VSAPCSTQTSLLPLLLPAVSSAGWYAGLTWTTDVLLLCSLFLLFLVPFTDTRAKYLLLFILLGCLLLQLPMLQGAFGWPDSTLLMLAGNRSFRIGYAAVLVDLYLLTVLAHGRKDSRTWQNIAFSLAISEQRVTIGRPFLIRYTLSTTRATPIKSIRINYPLKVMWLWPGSAAGELKGSQA